MATSNASKGFLGCAAVALWLGLFGAGLLIDSAGYRSVIVTKPVTIVATADASAGAESGAGLFHWNAFGASLLLYTPLNAALLTLLAGFVGGCASNITYCGQAPSASEDTDARARHLFLVESPFASTLRSFVVYLGILAGIYVVGESPFDHPTASQYARFAGTVSLLAFVVGYDPTKFQELMKFIPKTTAKAAG
jgi:hypothetical protein